MSAALDRTWRALSVPVDSTREPEGLDFLAREAGAIVRSRLPRTRRYLELASKVLVEHRSCADIDDASLAARVRASVRPAIRSAPMGERIAALAGITEIAQRSVGLLAHREQIAAALAMIDGCVVEMATGEGKTLSALLAAPLLAAPRKGCHIVTANDYLAERDADWTRPCFDRLGLRVASITGETGTEDRRDAYRADITYSTSRELAADFLRDRLMLGELHTVGPHALRVLIGGTLAVPHPLQRGLHCVIVDEADFVLIDDAVTPLLISTDDGSAPSAEDYEEARRIALALDRDSHYTVDGAHREIRLLSRANGAIDRIAAGRPLADRLPRDRDMMVRQALSAEHLYQRDRHYIVRDGEIVIVDESTGRTMPDRTWRDGMHQAVEAKEGLEVRSAKRTVARISFQRFFRMYPHLAGMSGTALEARREFVRIYRSPVVPMPTHQPTRRRVVRDSVCARADDRDRAIAEEASARSAAGQPVLIGSSSVADSEHLSRLLTERGVAHAVLNAVRHEQEAAVIAEAGEPGRVTVATNMAGRGTDIRLADASRAAGGLCVVAAGRALSARIDRQLFGRCARQGDLGEVVIVSSLDDELAERFFPRLRRTLAGLLRTPSGQRIATMVQRRAQRRAEAIAYARRRGVLKSDDWLEDSLGFAGRE
jgi:preprotein translocase subunit SecA